jgi:site-specific recombinase XerD
MKDYINRYLAYLEVEKNRNIATIKKYHTYLLRFANFSKIKNPEKVSPTLIRSFKHFLYNYRDEKGQSLTPATRNYHLIALRNFLRYCARHERLKVISIDDIELLSEDEREIKVLNEEQINRLLEAIDTSKIEGLRDRAILETLYSTGARVSEVAKLNRHQIDFKSREISIKGKRGRVRVIYLSKKAVFALKKYLDHRKDSFVPLFIRYGGKKFKDEKGEDRRLTPRAIQRIIKKWALKAGLAFLPTPHTMRHTIATILLKSGLDLRSVQEFLGHKNVSTTQIYTKVTNPQLKKMLEKFHPGNK